MSKYKHYTVSLNELETESFRQLCVFHEQSLSDGLRELIQHSLKLNGIALPEAESFLNPKFKQS